MREAIYRKGPVWMYLMMTNISSVTRITSDLTDKLYNEIVHFPPSLLPAYVVTMLQTIML